MLLDARQTQALESEKRMPKEKLMSIRDASLKTGVAEETILKQVKHGAIRGEKKSYFLWDEWFVSSREVDKIRKKENSSVAVAEKSTVVEPVDKIITTATLEAIHSAVSADAADDPAVVAANNLTISRELAAEIDRAFVDNALTEKFSALAQAATDEAQTQRDFQTQTQASQDQNAQEFATETEPVEADYIEPPLPPIAARPEAWTEYRQRAKTVAEEFIAPLLQRLEIQAHMLHEKDAIIEEQAAQLRLLPDYQRETDEWARYAADKERETFELRQNLTWERKKALIKLSSWQMKHIRAQKQIKETTDELSTLQEQRETEVNYLHAQLTQMQSQLTELQRPWWKRIFKSPQS
jgi:hypothetical protein